MEYYDTERIKIGQKLTDYSKALIVQSETLLYSYMYG